MTKRMKVTTIQLHEDTRKKLGKRKLHSSESYESVILRILNEVEIPTMKEMFRRADRLKHRKYSTAEIVKLTHELRNKYA